MNHSSARIGFPLTHNTLLRCIAIRKGIDLGATSWRAARHLLIFVSPVQIARGLCAPFLGPRAGRERFQTVPYKEYRVPRKRNFTNSTCVPSLFVEDHLYFRSRNSLWNSSDSPRSRWATSRNLSTCSEDNLNEVGNFLKYFLSVSSLNASNLTSIT